ncbi:MAG: ROK family protein [Bryobacteraceae bacterium]
MRPMDAVVAMDLGGTKLTSAVVNAAGRILYRNKVPAERGGVQTCIEQLTGAVHGAISASGLRPAQIGALGVIVPGIYFAHEGEVWAPNLWGHERVPLRAELERRLSLPVVIDSDRAGSVLGEQWLGVARGLEDVVFLAIGTGIGAGIIAGGRLLRGSGDIAGAVGWFALNSQQQEIYKQVGCWEAESAGPALARRMSVGSAVEVVAAARNGHALARNAVQESARYLGMGIANIVSILNPQLVVLGGGLMQASDLFLDTVSRVMQEWAQPIAAQQVRIEVTSLGDDAGLLGAACLALRNASVS